MNDNNAMNIDARIDQLVLEMQEHRAALGALRSIFDTLCEVLEHRDVATRAEIADCIRNTVAIALTTPIEPIQGKGLVLMTHFAHLLAPEQPKPSPTRPNLSVVH
jgi:hypothetical protein